MYVMVRQHKHTGDTHKIILKVIVYYEVYSESKVTDFQPPPPKKKISTLSLRTSIFLRKNSNMLFNFVVEMKILSCY